MLYPLSILLKASCFKNDLTDSLEATAFERIFANFICALELKEQTVFW